jgi:hypothetical protein
MSSKHQKKKTRIVCLHGYGTNADFMAFQMRKWVKKMKTVEFIFMNGDMEVPRQL